MLKRRVLLRLRQWIATVAFRLGAFSIGLALLSAIAGAFWAGLPTLIAVVLAAAGSAAGLAPWIIRPLVRRQQLRHTEAQGHIAQLHTLLDNTEFAIALTRNGKLEMVSQTFCRVFGWEKAQVQGQPTRIIYPNDEAFADLARRAFPAFVEHGAFEAEVELVRSNGATFWGHMRGRANAPGDLTQGTIWTVEDVTEARKAREALSWSATHDSLTGLANREAFSALLEQATHQAAERPFCALFIDLDRFKHVNDTAGHAAGDALLRDIAKQLSAQVRQSDTVARLGGDEFAVLLHQCPQAQAMVIAEKLRSAVESYVLNWEGQRFSVGASIGLVQADVNFSGHGAVIEAADAACYAAKRAGRNCVSVHTPQGDTAAHTA